LGAVNTQILPIDESCPECGSDTIVTSNVSRLQDALAAKSSTSIIYTFRCEMCGYDFKITKSDE
jgi:rRNA maturation protein Nop10